ncbi:lysylphosphatidylglycerol synthase domain-containing protein [Fulvimonas yonginensis]|uniref:Lysylphosphatidylglycerol synthase domain-containing protein n=1 Tax=Fulvimonas yonginensis TaxID=1495200 RepID=A0ABU8JDA8_9GAMM
MKTRLAKGLSVLLAIVATGYFIAYAWRALAGRDLSGLLDRQVVYAASALTALYAASISTTALAWVRMLATMKQPHPVRRLLPILAATQFGKYLPGNIAHHLGRVALARSVGIQVTPAILSVTYELVLALVAAVHVGALTLLWSPPEPFTHWPFARYRGLLLVLITLGAAALLLLAPRVVETLTRLRGKDPEGSCSGPLRLDLVSAAVCYSMYMSGLILIGFGLWLVAAALAPEAMHVPGPLFFIGAFASSWILGFIAPGAPAGLGVREAILSAWLAGVLPPAQAVLLIITLRIATTVGDLANFAWGGIVLLRQRI